MRFSAGDRVRWGIAPHTEGTVTRGGSEVVDVVWDDGTGYHGHNGIIDRIDGSTPVTVDDVPTDLDDPLLGGM